MDVLDPRRTLSQSSKMRNSPLFRATAFLLYGSLVSCGSGTVAPATPVQAEPVPVVLNATVSSAPAPVDAQAPAAVAPTAERIAPIAEPACKLELSSGRLASALHLQVQGHPLATLDEGVESVSVQISSDGRRGTAQVVTTAFRLDAEVEVPTLHVGLKPGVPLVDGWIHIAQGVVKEAAAGRATVAFRLPAWITPLQATGTADLACSDLTLYVASPSPWQGKELSLKQDARSDLRITPGGSVVAKVSGPKRQRATQEALELRTATVLSERAGLAQVRIGDYRGSAVGWIDARAIEPRTSSVFGILGALGGRGVDKETLVCARDAPLFAEVSGKVFRVGQLRAGAKISAQPRSTGGFNLSIDSMSDFFLGSFGTKSSERPLAPAELYIRGDADGCALLAKQK